MHLIVGKYIAINMETSFCDLILRKHFFPIISTSAPLSTTRFPILIAQQKSADPSEYNYTGVSMIRIRPKTRIRERRTKVLRISNLLKHSSPILADVAPRKAPMQELRIQALKFVESSNIVFYLCLSCEKS
ncbi:hypothetical protein BHYA_0004g00230 [Botrytis hyacinthi]|uniref:Uncharacterized protein n=1 Tax=Botrytis hyacinthi TaxID=278943 RepID=A0A4Z1HCY8_9HELO|nr:hypothetical protein BHYA_0004g00230 [Botrytis hyacinthi]